MQRFHDGMGTRSDIVLIGDLSKNMLGRTFCPLGDAAAMPTIAFVEKFRDEFEAHLDGKPMPVRKQIAAGGSLVGRHAGSKRASGQFVAARPY